MRDFFFAAVLLACSSTALAGTHTNSSWSSEPDGNGVALSTLAPGAVAYYNFDAATNSPVLPVSSCAQIYTRFVVVTAPVQADIQACDTHNSALGCSNLPNGTDLAASTDGDLNLAPEGGVAAGIKVKVDTGTGEGEVEVVCGGSR